MDSVSAWLGDNAIALGALAVSLATGSVQIADAVKRRHRVTLECRSEVVGSPLPDGQIQNDRYVVLTLRNLGRPISVEDIEFEGVSPSQDGEYISWHTPPDAVLALRPDLESLPSQFRPSRMVADGESCSWACRVGDPPDSSDALGATRLRAVARLLNGKVVRSEPIWHRQTPIDGEVH